MSDARHRPLVYIEGDGDELTVRTGGFVKAEDGGIIKAESGGIIKLEKGGKISVESGGEISVEPGGKISNQGMVYEAHTAGDTLLAAESGSIHSSVGASGAITLILPAATVGLNFEFYVGAAQELRLDPSGTQTIALPSTGVQGAAGKYLTANAVGEFVRLVCFVAGTWHSYPYSGTWAAEG